MTETATAIKLNAPNRGLLTLVRNWIPRDELFAGLYILGCANGLLWRIYITTDLSTWTGATLGLDLNAIVLFACFAGISAVLSNSEDQIRSADLGVALIFLGLTFVPVFALSWVAVTGLSLYILLFANGGLSRRRGALILLALTVPMLWSRILFQFFAKLILDIDAALVATMLGTSRAGNMVSFADQSGYMVVLPACSSLTNMSLAFLCWVTITQWAEHRWRPADILWGLLICASVIAVNVTRISLMGLSHWHYTEIHSPLGDMVGNSVMLVLMVGISILGVRRELFSRS